MKPEQAQKMNKVRNDYIEEDVVPNVGSNIRDKPDRRRYLINFLIASFGMGACIGVNGLAAESPLLVISAPEGSALPSEVAIVMVAAYVAPAIYALYNRSSSRLKVGTQFTWIFDFFVLGTIAMALLAFFHDVTTTFNGASYSHILLILCFISSSVSGLRYILQIPYLQHFEEAHLTSFFIGEGLSGFIPSLMALIQGVGSVPICPNNTTNSTEQPMPYIPTPNFPPRDYFLFLFALMLFSTCAFWSLEYLRVRTSSKLKDVEIEHDSGSMVEQNASKKLLDKEFENTNAIKMLDATNPTEAAATASSGNSIGHTIHLCMMMWLVCLVANGYLSTIEVFSSRPYGNSAHTLVVNLSQLASTAVCVLAFWLPPLGTRSITVIMGLVYIGTAYVTWLALCSPLPPWRDTTHGVVHLVTIWVLLFSLISYVKLAITAIVWKEASNAGLFQLGFAILTGAVCGCCLTFVLVNFTALFTPYARSCELRS